MKTTYIEDFAKLEGQTVTVNGWLYNRRTKGKLVFMILRDGTGICQAVVYKGDFDEETFKRCDTLPYESSLSVTGTVKKDERAPGGFELQAKSVVIHAVAEEYPIALQSDQGADHLLRHRHLWLRSRKQWAIMRIRSTVIHAIHHFFEEKGFVKFDAPMLTPNACEGTTTLFQLPYFEEGMAYLTQSGQLYGEAGALALGKIYTFGPCFRAEKSKTRNHLTEFWMIEPEIAYIEFDELMDLCEEFICSITQATLNKCRNELAVLERDITELEKIKAPFERITYDKALEMLKDGGMELPWGEDFGAPHQELLGKSFDKPFMVHHFPAQVKAFYMKPDPKNPKLAQGVDMYTPGGVEIIGGGCRAESLDYLEKQIAQHGLPKEAFEWYLDLRRYGTVPHGGFGLGLERTVAWLGGVHHIRECSPFPRMLYRIYP